jgi:hypothetical protein
MAMAMFATTTMAPSSPSRFFPFHSCFNQFFCLFSLPLFVLEGIEQEGTQKWWLQSRQSWR